MKKSVLVILPWMPYPLDTGGNQGVYNMLEYVSRYFNLILYFPLFYKKDRKLLNEFEKEIYGKYCIRYSYLGLGFNQQTAYAIHYFFDKFFLRKDIQQIHSKYLWVKNRPNYTCLKIIHDINDIICKERIENVQIEFMPMINIVYSLPKSIKKLFIHHEIQFVKFERQLNNLDNRTLYDDYRCRLLKDAELSALEQYDTIITLTKTDKEILVKEGVSSQIEISPLFIPHYNGYPKIKFATNEIVFIGGAKHAPNVEALDWFVSEVFPLLEEKGSFRFYVIGRGWDKKKYVGKNIDFLGFVEDLSSILPGKIMVVPILSGSGMRMKILEAVNNAVPFVSTTVGAEGMGFLSGVNCFIEDSPKDFCNAILQLFHDKKLQEKFVINARNHYEEFFSSDALGKKRVEILNGTFV